MNFTKTIISTIYLGSVRQTGANREFIAQGSATDIHIKLTVKGAGKVKPSGSVVFSSRATDGAAGENGEWYYNTTLNKFRAYQNGAWVDAIGGGTGLTDGDKGDITVTSSGAVWTIDNSTITFAKIQDSAAGLSVIGRGPNSAGVFAEISAGTDNFVLRRSGTSLAFGTVATGGITNSAITYTKIQDASAGLVILGRASNSSGVYAEIAAGADFNILRRSGTAIGFGAIDLAQAGAIGSSILALTNGGTGLSALGAANRILAVDNGATALEYKLASNGVTSASGSLKWGGPLTADTDITGAFTLNLGTSGSKLTSFNINTTGLISFNSGASNATSISFTGASGVSVTTQNTSISGTALSSNQVITSTNTIKNTFAIAIQSSGTPAIGFGAGMQYTVSNAANLTRNAGTTSVSWVDATNGAAYALYRIALLANDISTSVFEIDAKKDKQSKFFGPAIIMNYVTGSLPTASTHQYGFAYDTTINRPVYSNGTSWISIGAGVLQKDVATTTYTVTNADNGYVVYFTHASGCTVTMDDAVNINTEITGVRANGAGVTTFTSDGTSVLFTIDNAVTIDSEKGGVTWIKKTSTGWYGFGALGASGLTDGDKGDITVSSAGTVWTIDNNTITTAKILNSNVTYAKIQNVSVTGRLLGRTTAGAGDIEELTNIILGNTSDAGGRSITIQSSASNADLTVAAKGTGKFITRSDLQLGDSTVAGPRYITSSSSNGNSDIIVLPGSVDSYFRISRQGMGEQVPYLVLGAIGDSNLQRRIITTDGDTGGSRDVAGVALYTFALGFEWSDEKINIQSFGAVPATGKMNFFPIGANSIAQLMLQTVSDNSGEVTGGDGTNAVKDGGNLTVRGGSGYVPTGNGKGGNITIKSGPKRAGGSGTDGNVTIDILTGHLIISTIPTSSAGLTTGMVWANSGVLTRVP